MSPDQPGPSGLRSWWEKQSRPAGHLTSNISQKLHFSNIKAMLVKLLQSANHSSGWFHSFWRTPLNHCSSQSRNPSSRLPAFPPADACVFRSRTRGVVSQHRLHRTLIISLHDMSQRERDFSSNWKKLKWNKKYIYIYYIGEKQEKRSQVSPARPCGYYVLFWIVNIHLLPQNGTTEPDTVL